MQPLQIDRISSEQDTASAWTVLANLYQARLIRCHTPSAKRCKLETMGRIEALLPIDVNRGDGHAFGSSSQDYQTRYQMLQEEYQQFSKKLYDWIQDIAERHGLAQVTVFAPASMIKLLQQRNLEVSPVKLDLRVGRLMNAFDDALRRHPEILGLLRPKGKTPQAQTSSVPHMSHTKWSPQQSTDPLFRKTNTNRRVHTPIPLAAWGQ